MAGKGYIPFMVLVSMLPHEVCCRGNLIHWCGVPQPVHATSRRLSSTSQPVKVILLILFIMTAELVNTRTHG